MAKRKSLGDWLDYHEKEIKDVVIVGLLLIILVSILYALSEDVKKFTLIQDGKEFLCNYQSGDDTRFACHTKEKQ